MYDSLDDLGDQSFELASAWATAFSEGNTGGASGFRVMLWTPECSCLKVQDGSSYELVP